MWKEKKNYRKLEKLREQKKINRTSKQKSKRT